MHRPDPTELAQLLSSAGDEPPNRALMDRIFSVVADELRNLARIVMLGERTDHTLQPTALVHEAYLRLVDAGSIEFRGRTHFLGIAARAMRQILVDHARRRSAQKRGGDWQRVSLDGDPILDARASIDVLDLHDALTALADTDGRKARVVELRFFGGLTMEEIALTLGVTRRTAQTDWRVAKLWLARELADQDGRP